MISGIEFLLFACLAVSFGLGATLVIKLMEDFRDKSPTRLRRKKVLTINSRDSITAPADRWVETMTAQSGLSTDATTVLLLASALGGLGVIGGTLFDLALLISLLIGISLFGLVIGTLSLLAFHRSRKFEQHFPMAIEMISRSVRAGESFERAVQTAATTVEEPVANELMRLSQNLDFGYPVCEAMNQFVARNPRREVRIFAHSVSIHRVMGGRLADALARLANVLRMRADYLGKIRSATSLGRFASTGIFVIGLFALVYLLVAHPEYVSRLWSSELGKRMVYYAIISEIVGILWIVVTLNQEY